MDGPWDEEKTLSIMFCAEEWDSKKMCQMKTTATKNMMMMMMIMIMKLVRLQNFARVMFCCCHGCSRVGMLTPHRNGTVIYLLTYYLDNLI